MNRKTARLLTTILILIMILVLSLFLIAAFSEYLPFRNLSSLNDSLETEAPSETTAPSPQPGQTSEPTEEPAKNAQTSVHTPPYYPESPNRYTYAEDFYYERVSDQPELMERIRDLSFNESVNTKISYDALCYVRVLYVNFENVDCEGELICNAAIAQDLVEIFYELYQARYPIESIRLIDDFNADDDASMAANNTSAFNFRLTTGSTTYISDHSWGICVDLNPLYNPYVAVDETTGEQIVVPAEAAAYADRTAEFAYKIDEDDLAYQLFTQHGFTWGGHWESVKDYQHFQKEID